jgi:hypothetical protein
MMHSECTIKWPAKMPTARGFGSQTGELSAPCLTANLTAKHANCSGSSGPRRYSEDSPQIQFGRQQHLAGCYGRLIQRLKIAVSAVQLRPSAPVFESGKGPRSGVFLFATDGQTANLTVILTWHLD